jgi:hypothetical protein
VTEQAHDNLDLVPELLDPETGDFVGSIPMVGFGAGAYVLAILDRAATPTADPCFPAEGPDVPTSFTLIPIPAETERAIAPGGCSVTKSGLDPRATWSGVALVAALALSASRRRGGAR